MLRLLACGAALAVAATDFFPWGPVSTLTGGKVGYMQFTWRLLMFVAPALLALAGGYGVTELGGSAGRGGSRCAVHGGGLRHADALRRTAWGQIH